ncbi:MAG: hypothetical protein IT458_05875 [Planctomycetes bacterium]|nr:hypothetical protein [Planctomycetota bacterium]
MGPQGGSGGGVRVTRLPGNKVKIEVDNGADSVTWLVEGAGRSTTTKLQPDPTNTRNGVAIVDVPPDAELIHVVSGRKGTSFRSGSFPIAER